MPHQDLSELNKLDDSPQSMDLNEDTVASQNGHKVKPAKAGLSATNGLSPTKGILIGVGLGMAIVLIGGRIVSRPSAPAQAEAAPEVATLPTQTVTAVPVSTSPVAQTVEVGGTVSARDLLPVKAEVSGLQVKEVLVSEGDVVEAGQVLAILGDTVINAQVQEAQARLEASQAVILQEEAQLSEARAEAAEAGKNLDRYRSLADQGAVSQQELDSRATTAFTAQERIGVAQADVQAAQANLRSRRAELERLQVQLGQTLVRAPAAGVIAQTAQQPIADVGDITSNADPLFLIIQDDQLELLVAAHQSYLPLINPGIPVKVTSDSDPRVQIQGQVREIGEIVNPDTRLATVRINLPASDLIRPGMYLQAEAIAGETPGLTVPANAVVQKLGQSIVYRLVDGDIAEATPIELGNQVPATGAQPARVQILNGLSARDRVIVSGAGFIEDGDRVEVVEQ